MWFTARRAEGKPVTGPILVAKAKFYQTELGFSNIECQFSNGWLRNFKRRHGIRRLDISGETQSADVAAVDSFKIEFENFVKEHNLKPCQIYNADETGLLWRCLPDKTLVGGEEKNPKGFKMNKDRITVLLCSNASGDHKLTPLVIGKSKNPRAFEGIKNFPVIYNSQSNAWMDAEIFKYWFFSYFVLEVRKNFREIKMPTDS